MDYVETVEITGDAPSVAMTLSNGKFYAVLTIAETLDILEIALDFRSVTNEVLV